MSTSPKKRDQQSQEPEGRRSDTKRIEVWDDEGGAADTSAATSREPSGPSTLDTE